MRGRHDDRSTRIDDVGDQLLAVGRRRPGRPDVLQHVDAGIQRVSNVLLGVDMRVHLDPVLVRRLDDRLVVGEGEARVRLDEINACRREPLGLARGLFRRGDVQAAEADLHRAGGGGPRQARDPRSADQHPRTD